MLRPIKPTPPAEEARPHFLRFFPGLILPGHFNSGAESKAGRDTKEAS
jgi:hypothetical protein